MLFFSDEALQDEADVGGALAEPAHEVREPFLAERHVHAERIALGVTGTPAGRGGCRTASGTRTCPSRCAPAPRSWWSPRSSPGHASRSPDTCPGAAAPASVRRTPHPLRPSAERRPRAARGTRPSPAGRARPARSGGRHPARIACRYDWITDADVAVADAPDASRTSPASASVYGEFSMSMRTKKLPAVARSRTRRRLSMQVARSTSRPSCVSFSEILRPTPAASISADRRRT